MFNHEMEMGFLGHDSHSALFHKRTLSCHFDHKKSQNTLCFYKWTFWFVLCLNISYWFHGIRTHELMYGLIWETIYIFLRILWFTLELLDKGWIFCIWIEWRLGIERCSHRGFTSNELLTKHGVTNHELCKYYWL